MFTKDYVSSILAPFVGVKLRMGATDCIPFFLEPSMEGSFKIELCEIGIRFLLKDNYHIQRYLEESFKGALKEVGIPLRELDTLLKDPGESHTTETIAFDAIISHIKKGLTPQIGFTYYTMIRSLKVDEKSFHINNVKFFIAN